MIKQFYCNNTSHFQDLSLDLDTMDFGQLDGDFGAKMETHQELIDIGMVPMDMDEPDWLESLLPQSSPPLVTTTSTMTLIENDKRINLLFDRNDDICDPLLTNIQESFDPFNIEDTDFKITSDSPSSWNN